MTGPAFGALRGVRVVDFTHMLAGPFCTQMLADHGADVIKVEPLEGESARRVSPFRADDTAKRFGGYFASVNRNKRSIAIDLKSAEGRDIVRRLVRTADAVVESFRTGVMERFGLGYESLFALNPKLVYAAIRGFGDPRTGASPYGDWPAYDVVAQAMGGVIQINGPDRHTPMKVGPGVGDLVPATMCAFGITAALLHAQRTGRGQFLDVSMVDAVLALCERVVHQRSFENVVPHPEGNRHAFLSPFGLVRAADGFVTIAAPSDAWWQTLCRLIGRDDLVTDVRTATNEARVLNRDFVYAEVERFTSSKTKQELVDLLGGKFPFGPVYDICDIEADPHFAAREMIIEVEHPGIDGKVRIAGIPVKMAATPGRVSRRAPLLGEDSEAILRDVGYSTPDISMLRAQGIII
jgi:crotonobetainyl-CoA:carnitine CoA-transferase CaiB-like acyl-CoA transferase